MYIEGLFAKYPYKEIFRFFIKLQGRARSSKKNVEYIQLRAHSHWARKYQETIIKNKYILDPTYQKKNILDPTNRTSAHALFHCDHAKLKWAHWPNCPVKLSHPTREPVDIVLEIIEKGSSHDLELFFAVAWSIWWNRNQAVHDDSGSPPSRSWEMASRALIDFKEAYSHPPLLRSPPAPNWRAPPSCFFKINADGAASDDGTNSSIGVIIRDIQGDPIAASSKTLPSPTLQR